LAEGELVMTRAELDELRDRLYVLEAAIEDIERDLAGTPTKRDYEEAVAWVIEAAEPLFRR
jgi:BMFP domain-containing protein YqiC